MDISGLCVIRCYPVWKLNCVELCGTVSYDMEKFIELGKTFSLEGAELLTFVEKQQALEEKRRREEEEKEERLRIAQEEKEERLRIAQEEKVERRRRQDEEREAYEKV